MILQGGLRRRSSFRLCRYCPCIRISGNVGHGAYPMSKNVDPSLSPRQDGGTSPNGPASAVPVHGIDLAGYASLMTRLAAGQPRHLLLSGANLDEKTWLEVEKTWGLRLAAAAQRADTQTLLDFEKAVAETQRSCPPPDPSHTMAKYAAMVARLENGTAPIAVCAQYQLK